VHVQPFNRLWTVWRHDKLEGVGKADAGCYLKMILLLADESFIDLGEVESLVTI